MRLIDEYRDPEQVRALSQAIRESCGKPMVIMEVCGTHTMAIGKFGIRNLLPPEIKLISGPGCPVCVTPQGDIDNFIELAMRPNVITTIFGDMMRVPGTVTSIESARANGADVRIVYSAADALDLARNNPEKEVVFFGVGFETTTPGIAITISIAAAERLTNLSVFSTVKTIPAALAALMTGDGPRVNGLLLPGHVTTMIGTEVYENLARDMSISCVVSGFEPLDILQSVLMLIRQFNDGRSEVENQYSRAVNGGVNVYATRAVGKVFEPCDAVWRGIGTIPMSGLKIRSEFAAYDAQAKFGLSDSVDSSDSSGCKCGEMLRGISNPPECPLFGSACTPSYPVGPCMVSTEGTCAAWYKYGIKDCGTN